MAKISESGIPLLTVDDVERAAARDGRHTEDYAHLHKLGRLVPWAFLSEFRVLAAIGEARIAGQLSASECREMTIITRRAIGLLDEVSLDG